MKKIITGIIAVSMIAVLLIGMTGCTSAKKQEAVDAFNQTSAAFNEAATLINNNSDAIDDETITTFQDMSALLSQYKTLLEGDTEISDEKYDEMIKWFGEAKTWAENAKTEIEGVLSDSEK